MTKRIRNFGRNLDFVCEQYFEPTSEAELLAILRDHPTGTIRVIASKHAWSAGIVSEDVIINLKHFHQVTVEEIDGITWATVGGGCQVKRLLKELRQQADVTMPSVGLITEQTIAGAISTATHGSGKHSLSHYLEEIRVATFDPETGEPTIVTFNSGPELQAARCALGCLGIIVSVKFRTVPNYSVVERISQYDSVDEVLTQVEQFPLQQFFLLPHGWTYSAQHRRVTTAAEPTRNRIARWYHLYWLVMIDIGLHLMIKLMACVFRSRRMVRFFYRRLLPKLIRFQNRDIIDRSDKMLVMEHELFRHLEIELFVPESKVADAAKFTAEALALFDGSRSELSARFAQPLQDANLLETLSENQGVFTHHYAVCFRRVLADDTLISMSVSDEEASYYAISFITYVRPRDQFFQMAECLAHSLKALFQARPHWGKYHPLTVSDLEPLYPQMPQFREICERYDPQGRFQNEHTRNVLGFRQE